MSAVRKARKEPAKARSVCVTMVSPAIDECGIEGGASGDVCVRASIRKGQGRFDVANKLEELARYFAHTYGDPIDGAEIFIVYSHKRRT